jgi:hypothetical protein
MSNSLEMLKKQARTLRKSLAETGHAISHTQSLELIAKQRGYRDWNTLHAQISQVPTVHFQVGQRVSGTYLGHRFAGTLKQVDQRQGGACYGVTIRFDAPIDVIPFEGMSSLRQQVSARLDRHGRTFEKTSDGRPHVVLD